LRASATDVGSKSSAESDDGSPPSEADADAKGDEADSPSASVVEPRPMPRADRPVLPSVDETETPPSGGEP